MVYPGSGMAASVEQRVGETVGGRYRLLRALGEGAFGAVYEAEHLVTSRHVALKILHPHLVNQPGLAQRFLREAQTVAKLHHPGIVEVLDAGQDPDETLFLALELLEGETLDHRLARGPLS